MSKFNKGIAPLIAIIAIVIVVVVLVGGGIVYYYNTIRQQPVSTTQPSITIISGPTSLQVGEMGTWQVGINYPVNTMDKLSFYVVWGDEQIPPAKPSYVGPNTASGADDAAKFSHTYNVAGTYHPTFTVINQYNQSAQASASVDVGSVSQSSITITSPNGGEVWKIGETHNITWTNTTNVYPYIYLVEKGSKSCTSGVSGQFVSCIYTIAIDIPSMAGTHTYPWLTIGGRIQGGSASIPPGSYTIEICQSAGANCDESDATFSIVAP